MDTKSLAQRALDQGKGIVRLAPTWVPRSFCVPGRRIKLHPDDYYVLGGIRGGIDERWLSSTTPAKNGPLTGENEGLSAVVFNDGGKEQLFLLKDAIDELKELRKLVEGIKQSVEDQQKAPTRIHKIIQSYKND